MRGDALKKLFLIAAAVLLVESVVWTVMEVRTRQKQEEIIDKTMPWVETIFKRFERN
jgi:hypothetical protein